MADAGKRAVSEDGLVHGFVDEENKWGQREAWTRCHEPVWETGIMFDGWRIVSKRPITCLRCIGSR